MNKERRKQIAAIVSRVNELAVPDLEAFKTEIDEIHDAIDEIREHEQDYFDNMPESLQSGDKGVYAEAAIEALQRAMDALETIAGHLEEIINLDFSGITDHLDTAQE